ncbi:beta-ketoacyl-ACP synthase II [Elusimicrobiota bacterium]
MTGTTNRLKGKSHRDRRVVVTGMGTLNPLGLCGKESWANAVNGVSGVDRVTRFDVEGYASRIAGEVKNFDPERYLPKKDLKKMDIYIHYALAATRMALDDSGLVIDEKNAERVGVYLGSGIGGLTGIEKQHDVIRERGPSKVTPFFIPGVVCNMASGHVSIRTGAKGPNLCQVTACATGAHVLGESAHLIERGVADVMIAGSSESAICPLTIAGFSAMRALSTRNDEPKRASRPFDRDRDGFVLGEGATVLILEDYEHARSRGARVLAEISGYGLSGDAYHFAVPPPDGSGPSRAMSMALADAELDPADLQYINAHGTSTPAGDPVENLAIRKVFGEHAAKLLVSSTKSMTGHLLAGAGSLESFFCIMALADDTVPPTINLEHPGEGCDLDFVPNEARRAKLRHVMNNNFGFGGTNACLILSKV